MPVSLAYYRPDTVDEATHLYTQLSQEGDRPTFYSGGTEILTFRRSGLLSTSAVIDIKAVPGITSVGRSAGQLTIGAGLTLEQISTVDVWPALTATVDRIADHTSRSKITLGGNIASALPYREAALPWMLIDCWVHIGTPSGIDRRDFSDVFDGSLHLSPGEFVIAFELSEEDVSIPFKSWKMTRMDWIDYPLVTVVAFKKHDGIRLAITGYGKQPFRAKTLEQAFNPVKKGTMGLDQAIRELPIDPVDDLHGSGRYRQLVLAHALENILDDAHWHR